MKRATIWVQRGPGNNVVCSVTGVRHKEGRKTYPLELDLGCQMPECGESPGRMEEFGKRLSSALRTHPAIDEAVFGMLINPAVARQRDPYLIYFDVEDDDDQIPWEALHSGSDGFVALDERWAIGRVQEPQTATDSPVRDFFYPLRFSVVLSSTPEEAGGIAPSALDHWKPLEGVLKSAETRLRDRWRASKSTFDVLVLTNDDDVKHYIDDSSIKTWVRCEYIESESSMINELHDHRPHFIHMLCHGMSRGPNGPTLTLGTRQDRFRDAGSIHLGPSHLYIAKPSPPTWLVTLSACNSASSAGGVDGFARALVAQGIPAAVGMREPIDNAQAARFSSTFYKDVFARVESINIKERDETVDWAFALHSVRKDFLAKSHPEPIGDDSCRHWTIPVLYSTTGNFTVRFRGARGKTSTELVTELRLLEGMRKPLKEASAQAPDLRAFPDALAEIERQITVTENELRDNADREYD